MNFELQPESEPGRCGVALAEEHALDFATRAGEHDREGSFPFENFTAMQRSGLLAACVPEALGGLGVESLFDMALCVNRIARGDSSTALGLNMHIASTWYDARRWKAARAADDETVAQRLETTLRKVAHGETIIAMIGSEAGADLRHPMTEATRVEGGWLLNGRKTFGTLSPVANELSTRARVVDPDGGYLLGTLRLPANARGLTIRDNWDALGMRASGSNDLIFEDCFVPEAMLTVRGRWGDFEEQPTPVVPLGLTAAFLGIAQAAQQIALTTAGTRRSAVTGRALAERYALQHAIATIEIDLAAARAMLERSGRRAAAFLAAHPPASAPPTEWHDLYKDCQCAKWFVNQAAIRIVDQALTASGGAGYMSKSPLSRLYRDVRAGPFMAPLTETEALEYIGRVALGLEPSVEV